MSFHTGKGLFALRKFMAGEFLLEYKGSLTNASAFLETDDDDLTYIYYFEHEKQEMW